MSHLKNYLSDESGSESIEKIIGIGVGVIIAIAGAGFMTYQFNKAAADGAVVAGTDASAPAQIKMSGGLS